MCIRCLSDCEKGCPSAIQLGTREWETPMSNSTIEQKEPHRAFAFISPLVQISQWGRDTFCHVQPGALCLMTKVFYAYLAFKSVHLCIRLHWEVTEDSHEDALRPLSLNPEAARRRLIRLASFWMRLPWGVAMFVVMFHGSIAKILISSMILN